MFNFRRALHDRQENRKPSTTNVCRTEYNRDQDLLPHRFPIMMLT